MFPCTTLSWLFSTPTPCWFRVFSVFNFLWRNCTEFSCTERARQYRVCSVCFPCLILYHGTTRNFRVQRVHGDIVLIPCVFRVSFSMTELHGIFVFWSCTVIPFLFRMFTVFNFRSRNHTELWCMTTSYWFREFSVSHFQWRNCTELSCTVCACTRKSCSFRMCSV